MPENPQPNLQPDQNRQTFQIHFNAAPHKEEPKPEEHPEPKPEEQTENKVAQKRSLKEILKDAGRQIFASAVILVLAFAVLNYSALSQIAKSKFNKVVGIENVSPLEQFTEIETDNVVYTQEILKTSNDLGVQKTDIPALDIEIAPTDNRLIIPRIDQNIPIVKVSSESLIKRDWNGLEKEMQEALQDGVVHYPGTSLPGQTGNVVITGHSSYFPWDPGRFKDVFALLHEVVIGDRIVVYYEQDKYLYEVNNIQIVMPSDIEVLKQTPADQLTLITCTPVGTNLKRLVVSAKPIAKNGKPIEL
ncbi:sortase [Candidatus Peregrinibacteria bacterium]|nr:sortase [Candidatus Peregrinibacteria bacterium]